MFVPLCVGALFVLALCLGADLTRLGRLRLRRVWLPVAALLVQIVVIEVVGADLPAVLDKGLHVLTYVAAGVFLWDNRRVPGLPLLGLGALSNGTVIALNGGQLPLNAHAMREAGLVQTEAFHNNQVLAHPVLPWLGDVLVTPSWLPFRTVISVGDVLILLGALWLVLAVAGTHWTRPWVSAQPDPVVAPEGVGVDERTPDPVVA